VRFKSSVVIRRALLLIPVMFVASVAVPVAAQAGPRDPELVIAVTQYLSGENAVTVDAPSDQGVTQTKKAVSDGTCIAGRSRGE
jgi:ABC-type dipeptide/oligopeptide/nickel transport system permease component